MILARRLFIASLVAPTVVTAIICAATSAAGAATPAQGLPLFNDAAMRCQASAPSVVAISFISLIPIAFLIGFVLLAMGTLEDDERPAETGWLKTIGIWLFSPAIGVDGRLSLSKLQFYVWTFVLVYCYCVLALFRLDVAWTPQCVLDAASQLGALTVPSNVWIVLGMSSITLIGAKGITNSQVRNNLISKTRIQPRLRFSDLVWDDVSNSFSLSRLQMLIWTLVAVAIYLLLTYSGIHGQNTIYHDLLSKSAFPPVTSDLMNRLAAYPGLHFVQAIPNVDTTLLVLMGLSQATYIGNKLTITTPPAIYSLGASRVAADGTVTINGNNFGNTATTGQILLNNVTLDSKQIVGWSDSQITFTVTDWSKFVPATAPGSTAPVTLTVASSGVVSGESMPLEVIRPQITGVNPPLAGAPANATFTISGAGFGSAQTTSANVSLDGAVVATTSWADGQIVTGPVAAIPAGAKMMVSVNGLTSL